MSSSAALGRAANQSSATVSHTLRRSGRHTNISITTGAVYRIDPDWTTDFRPMCHSAGLLPIGRFGGRSPPKRDLFVVAFCQLSWQKATTKQIFSGPAAPQPQLASKPAVSRVGYSVS